MIKYQYQVIRYIHDQFTGEFGNVGIVLFAPEQEFLSCKIISRYSRLSEFFGDINGQFLISNLRKFQSNINRIAKGNNTLFTHNHLYFHDLKNINDLQSITNAILPKDDSALQLTNVFYGIDLNPEIALHDIFSRIIDRYNAESHTSRQSDQLAWRKVYKNYFEKYGISKKLKKHTVNTKKDTIEFDKAWKNGVWHCFQPLALDLKSEDSIKSKVYKWSGIIRELETTNESVHVYFLTTTPKEHLDLTSFIDDTLTVKDKNLIVDIIKEEEAETFAAKVRRDMDKSNNHDIMDNLFM